MAAIEKEEERTNERWLHWGTNPYKVMPHISPESKRIGETFQLRPTDVIVISFPKTGTTWTQNCCEQLRTGAGGYDFDDITIRQPWIELYIPLSVWWPPSATLGGPDVLGGSATDATEPLH